MKVSGIDINAEAARLSALASVVLDQTRRKAGLSKTELARRVGVSPSRVTKVLDGESNVTLETIARFGLACGTRLVFRPILTSQQRMLMELMACC